MPCSPPPVLEPFSPSAPPSSPANSQDTRSSHQLPTSNSQLPRRELPTPNSQLPRRPVATQPRKKHVRSAANPLGVGGWKLEVERSCTLIDDPGRRGDPTARRAPPG